MLLAQTSRIHHLLPGSSMNFVSTSALRARQRQAVFRRFRPALRLLKVDAVGEDAVCLTYVPA